MENRNTVSIMDIPIDNLTMQEAIDRLRLFLRGSRVHTVYTPNAEILMAALRNSKLKSILCEADMLVADGAGVVLASKILGAPVKEKVSGIDLVRNSMSASSWGRTRYYLLGGKPGVAEAAAEKILKAYVNVEIAGCRNGYFKDSDEPGIIEDINSSDADILLVALGAPKQEEWIYRNRSRLKVKVAIGVGGTLDVLAGKVRLAPEFMRKAGLEWLYRLYKEPWRYKRMLELPRFVLLVLKMRFFRKNNK
ncbi:MAG: WecB/TagA/CpsF family glycosyltransferase [Clostridia bacterium]|nr:WecB/TagA/CpsF family glycosyltransferase [Clostridia bacterium]